jgi:hypothetical protein
MSRNLNAIDRSPCKTIIFYLFSALTTFECYCRKQREAEPFPAKIPIFHRPTHELTKVREFRSKSSPKQEQISAKPDRWLSRCKDVPSRSSTSSLTDVKGHIFAFRIHAQDD